MQFLIENQFVIVHLEEYTSLDQSFNLKKQLLQINMMQQRIVNEEGFKSPSEAEEKHFFSALKKRFDFRGANPEAKKEFEPKNSKQKTITPSGYFKTPLVVYKEIEQNVTCTYCLAGTLPNHQPSLWTKCKDNNSDLNNTYSSSYDETSTLYSSNNEYWHEEVNHMDLAPYSYEEYLTPASPRNSSEEYLTPASPRNSSEEYYPEYLTPASPMNSSVEYYPEYLTPASPMNSSSNNVYWVEGQEMAQNDEYFYNQTTYYSVDQTQMDNVWLEPNTEDSTSLQTSPEIWYNNTYYYNF